MDRFSLKSEGVTFWWLRPSLTSGGKTMICDAELTSPSYSACWKTLLSPFSSISEGVANVLLNALPAADSNWGEKSHQKVTPSDFNETRFIEVSQHAEYDGEISFSSHIIVCPPEGKTGQSHQEEISEGKTMICDAELTSPSYSACWKTLFSPFSSISEGVANVNLNALPAADSNRKKK